MGRSIASCLYKTSATASVTSLRALSLKLVLLFSRFLLVLVDLYLCFVHSHAPRLFCELCNMLCILFIYIILSHPTVSWKYCLIFHGSGQRYISTAYFAFWMSSEIDFFREQSVNYIVVLHTPEVVLSNFNSSSMLALFVTLHSFIPLYIFAPYHLFLFSSIGVCCRRHAYFSLHRLRMSCICNWKVILYWSLLFLRSVSDHFPLRYGSFRVRST